MSANNHELLTKELVATVIAALLPDLISRAEALGRQHIHIVVVGGNNDLCFTLYNGGINDVATYPTHRPFHKIAEAKAMASFQLERDTVEVITKYPYLLTDDDPLFAGGVHRPAFAVGVSGLKEGDDHQVANEIADAILLACVTKFNELRALVTSAETIPLFFKDLFPQHA